uniref:UTP--glucose-1-phosphate uridylyltransferase n=1 Tax=Amphora coffeiformis TaxID=265554 RepID=A0A7S3L4E3_9STRA
MNRQGLALEVFKRSAKTKKWLDSQSRAFSFNPLDKFAEILSFHDGVAAVRERNGPAYHIDENGTALYDSHRYKRTFGFYAANRAAVMDFEDKMFHIDITGGPVYENRYAWCGNFHAVPKEGIFRSPVRDSNNYYYYIDQHGEVALGPFSYAGDPNSAGQSVVQDFDGNPKIINHDGKNWCTATRMEELNLIEACVPHKGVAAVRNENGWFYIDQAGHEVGRGRYKFAEPHYNGQARVRFLNGQWSVIDEAGQVTANLGEAMLSSAAELESISKRYWESLALKHILENNVLEEQERRDIITSTPLRILEDCAVEMGLLRREPTDASRNELLNRGKLLAFHSSSGDANGVTEARCRYWLQDRYLNAWLEHPQDKKPNRDTFADLASNPALVNQSLDVLKSYADSDWKGAAVPVSKLLDGKNRAANIRTIVDMGGGYGSLLRELHDSGLLRNTEEFICVDRPEVIASVLSSSASPSPHSGLGGIKHEVGDLFNGPIHAADLYLMSRVLHDWSDPQAATILDRMHLLSPEHARLVVIDRVSTPDQLHALLSLHMYMLQGSHERSHEQWQELFTTSGWKIDGIEDFNGHKVFLLTKASRTQENPTYKAVTTTVETAEAPPTVRKALITVGGLGTRMEPQSIITPKALLPITSRENTFDTLELQLQPPKWEVRPALAYLLDQMQHTSHTIDQVCVVSTPWQIPLLRSFLNDYQERQKRFTATTEKKNLEIQIAIQQSASGFGDAILAARNFIRNEPFLLAMGDHIYSSACVENMLTAYNELVATSDWRGTALTGVTLCGESEVQATGLLRNHQYSSYPLGSPWLVHEMVEKPSSDYDSFQVLLDDTMKYHSQLGMDVLPPGILTFLQAEKEQIAPSQEVCLRKILRESWLGDAKLYGCLIDGKRLDIGNPGAYNKALKLMANDDSSTYVPPKLSSPAQVSGMQEQDKILQSVLAIQQQDSGHIPATLRHLLFGRNGTTPTDSAGICIGSSPGRMDLMGGFADYSGSYAIQHPTHERVVALSAFEHETKTETPGMIRLASIQVDDISEMSQAIAKGDFVVNEADFPTRYLFTSDGRLKSDSQLKDTLSKTFAIDGIAIDRWVAYLTGMIHRLYQQKSNAGDPSPAADFTIVTLSDLPWNSGLASSAAVEVATAFSLGTALHLPSDVLNPIFVASISKQVENRVVGGQCGIMDQLAVTHPGATRTTEHPLVGMRCRMPLVELPTT